MHSFESSRRQVVAALRWSCALAASAGLGASQAATIRVPADQATIQSGINVAQAGDQVLVAPGSYRETLDFLGKAITVISEAGPKKTIIDARSLGPVVTFISGETTASRLSGFTLKNGRGDNGGGGIYIYASSPTIDHNRIIKNTTGYWGGGIYVGFASPSIHHNLIASNSANGEGGGIELGGAGSASVTDNVIEHNQGGSGIGMWASGTPKIERNIIRYNIGSNGGGVAAYNDNRPTFVNNLLYGNQANNGGGLYLMIPYGAGGGTYTNNTVVGNTAAKGTEAYLAGFAADLPMTNNILRGQAATAAVYCDGSYDPNSPQFEFNNVIAASGPAAQGTCASTAVSGTNMSVVPGFVDEALHRYGLGADSALVDAGSNAAVNGIKRDLARNRRVVDGGHGAIVDIGAYEYQPN